MFFSISILVCCAHRISASLANILKLVDSLSVDFCSLASVGRESDWIPETHRILPQWPSAIPEHVAESVIQLLNCSENRIWELAGQHHTVPGVGG